MYPSVQLVPRLCHQVMATTSFASSAAKRPTDKARGSAKRRKLANCDAASEPPHEVLLSVLQDGSPGHGSCAYLYTSFHRYLFNIPENSKRFCIGSSGIDTHEVNHVFCTSPHWRNIGGLASLAMEKRDAQGSGRLHVYGPKRLQYIIAASLRFATVPDIDVVGCSYQSLPVFEDSCMTVEQIPLMSSREMKQRPRELGVKLRSDTNYRVQDVSKMYKTVIDDLEAEERQSEGSLLHPVAVAYLATLKPRRGKLDVKRCLELGVPTGPLFGKLQKGERVELEDGRWIEPHQVLSPDKPGSQFLVLECPDETYLDALLASPRLKSLQESCYNLVCIAHLSPDEIVRSPKYQGWLQRFPSGVAGLTWRSSQAKSIGMHSPGVLPRAVQLNALQPQVFALPAVVSSFVNEVPSSTQTEVEVNSPQLHEARPRLAFRIRPTPELDSSACFDWAAIVDETKRKLNENEELTKALEENKELFHVEEAQYPIITHLGTASAVPTKYRNLSGVLVQLTDDRSLLLDCGEGILTQLMCKFGVEGLKHQLGKLRAVFISHMHPDHHSGIPSIVIARQQALNELNVEHTPLHVLAPRGLFALHDIASLIVEDLSSLYERRVLISTPDVERVCEALDLSELNPVPVYHIRDSYGLALTTKTGCKIVYSGDTRPAQSLVKAGMNADVLIHEATVDDSMAEHALKHRHSTVSEAISVGVSMQARTIVLTHFSGRYGAFPLLPDGAPPNVAVAFDFMTYGVNQAASLPKLKPLLSALLAEKFKQDMYRRRKRLLDDERDFNVAENELGDGEGKKIEAAA